KLKDALKLLREASAENWKKFAGRIGELISIRTANAAKLSTKLKSIYDDLVKTGYKASDEGAEIIFRTTDNVTVAKISDDALQIKIPDNHGTWAKQSNSANAIEALDKVNNGSSLYRMGTLNRSAAAEAQYWSLENPLDIKDIKIFAQKYGIPEENLKSG